MCYNIKLLPIIYVILCLIFNTILAKNLNPYFYFNTTKSLPRGLYWVIKKTPTVGDLVVIDLPIEAQNFLFIDERLAFKGLLLKSVIAMNGDYICKNGNSIMVNNQIKLTKNQRLNLYPICRKLTTEELFVAVVAKDNSLDSRYFGPILLQNLRAVVIPLIVFN